MIFTHEDLYKIIDGYNFNLLNIFIDQEYGVYAFTINLYDNVGKIDLVEIYIAAHDFVVFEEYKKDNEHYPFLCLAYPVNGKYAKVTERILRNIEVEYTYYYLICNDDIQEIMEYDLLDEDDKYSYYINDSPSVRFREIKDVFDYIPESFDLDYIIKARGIIKNDFSVLKKKINNG